MNVSITEKLLQNSPKFQEAVRTGLDVVNRIKSEREAASKKTTPQYDPLTASPDEIFSTALHDYRQDRNTDYSAGANDSDLTRKQRRLIRRWRNLVDNKGYIYAYNLNQPINEGWASIIQKRMLRNNLTYDQQAHRWRPIKEVSYKGTNPVDLAMSELHEPGQATLDARKLALTIPWIDVKVDDPGLHPVVDLNNLTDEQRQQMFQQLPINTNVTTADLHTPTKQHMRLRDKWALRRLARAKTNTYSRGLTDANGNIYPQYL